MNGAGEGDWTEARQLDVSGLKCPLPALLTERALNRMNEGARLVVIATDPLASLDLRHLCGRDGHVLQGERQAANGARQFLICCGPRC